MKLGQIFTWDLIFGVFIFLAILAITIHVWNTSYDELRYAEEEYEMSWLAETVSEQLVRTAGEPYDWDPHRAVTYGLAEIKDIDKTVDSRILDPDKILNLIDAFKDNYTTVRNQLTGSSKYDIYLELSCMNSDDLRCLQGLKLDTINTPVYCNNYRLGVTDYKTESYLWFEAEDLWDNNEDSYCLMKGCSGDNMSALIDSDYAVVNVDPGKYMIWVRLLEDYTSSAKLVVEDIEYQMFGLGVHGLAGWNWVGEQDLEAGEIVLGYRDAGIAGYLVDAVLLTTNRFYDPSWDNPGTYGNPNTEQVCIIGNYGEGSMTISTSKTAVVGEPLSRTETFMGMQRIMDKTVGIKVVIWGGTPVTPRTLPTVSTSSTTTTLPQFDILCTGSPDFNCNATNPSVIDVHNIQLWTNGFPDNTVTCGTEKNITVQWRGRHAGDPNYFSFYIDDEYYFIGACESDNTASESPATSYDYDMNCTLTIPNASVMNIADGLHSLIVVAEDQLGYCSVEPSYASVWDDRHTVSVDLAGCVAYDSLTCNPTPSPSLKYTCDQGPYPMDTVDDVHRVVAPGGSLICGVDNPVNVFWDGTHGNDNDRKVFWTFVVNHSGGYTCVGTCESQKTDDPVTANYDMSCTLHMNNSNCGGTTYSIDDGTYTLYAIAESYNYQYCRNPASPNAEAFGTGTVSIFNCEVCNSCDPPINNRIILVLQGMAGDFAPWNGAHNLMWYSGCVWRKTIGSDMLVLWWDGVSWHLKLHENSGNPMCYIEWAKTGVGIECDPYGSASYTEIDCEDSGCVDTNSCGNSNGTIIIKDLMDASLTYYVLDMPGVTTGAEVHTDTSGSWALTPSVPAPGWTETQEYTIIIENVSVGSYIWNIMLMLNPPPDMYLYSENQSFTVT